MLALREAGHLLNVFSQPLGFVGKMYKAVLDRVSNRVQPHDFVQLGLVASCGMKPLIAQFLNQLGP